MRIDEQRRQIPALSRMTYLDNAGAGLPPATVTAAMKDLIEDWSMTGEHWEEWLLDVVEARRRFARLTGGSAGMVGVIPSVSVGLAAVGSSIATRGKKVVASALNFPTNVIMWQRMREAGLLGAVTVLNSRGGVVPIEAYERSVDDRTALVAVDYVSWLSGAREDIGAVADIAHRHGALLLVDAFHGLGVFPVDMKKEGIDVLVSGFYKWLCGPHGVACVCVNENANDSLVPSYLGWMGIRDNVVERVRAGRDPFDAPLPLTTAPPSRGGAKFEWGTWATVAVKGAIESMKFAERTEPAVRYRRIRSLKARLFEGLSELGVKMLTPPLDANPGGGIVTFACRKHPRVVRALGERNVVVSGRFGHLRVSPHFYNVVAEVDEFLDDVRPLIVRGAA